MADVRHAHAPTPAELLFEFVRGSDQAPMSCELKVCGESYGWQATFHVRGEFLASRGAFPLKAAAVQWAVMSNVLDSDKQQQSFALERLG